MSQSHKSVPGAQSGVTKNSSTTYIHTYILYICTYILYIYVHTYYIYMYIRTYYIYAHTHTVGIMYFLRIVSFCLKVIGH